MDGTSRIARAANRCKALSRCGHEYINRQSNQHFKQRRRESVAMDFADKRPPPKTTAQAFELAFDPEGDNVFVLLSLIHI